MKNKRFLVSKDFYFDAAHSLPNYNGKCEKLHGHRWRVRVTVWGELDESTGIAVDFKEIGKTVKNEIIDKVDHTYLNDILEHPSAENIALLFFEKLKNKFNIHSIEVWETPQNKVTYIP